MKVSSKRRAEYDPKQNGNDRSWTDPYPAEFIEAGNPAVNNRRCEKHDEQQSNPLNGYQHPRRCYLQTDRAKAQLYQRPTRCYTSQGDCDQYDKSERQNQRLQLG